MTEPQKVLPSLCEERALFEVPAREPKSLDSCRRRLEKAEAAIKRAEDLDEECDGFGIIPPELRHERDAALRALRRAESAAWLDFQP